MKIYKNSLDIETKEIAESLLFNGNGRIGVRNVFDEDEYDDYSTNRHVYLSGFYETYNINYPEVYYGASRKGEQAVPVIEGLTSYIYIGKHKFNLNSSNILEHTRYLDISKGISVRKVSMIDEEENKTEITFSKVCSFINKNLFITKVDFNRINHNLPIKIETVINLHVSKHIDKSDPRVGHNSYKLNVDELNCINKKVLISTNSCKCYFQFDMNKIDEIKQDGNRIIVYSNLTDDSFIKSYSYDLNEYIEPSLDFDNITREQEQFMNSFWDKSLVEIDSKYNLNESVNYGTFALLQSLSENSISAKGLSGIGYEGHVFWDAEMFVFPNFVYTQPDLARKMLEYRINLLDKAIENRKLVGYADGALYAWRTISGIESSSFFEAGMAQHHLSLDICFAIHKYTLITDDYTILDDGGYNVLIEVFKLFNTLIYKNNNKYHLDMITGPDEYSALVNDNLYTNLMLNSLVKFILDLHNTDKYKVDKKLFDRLNSIKDNMHISVNKKLKILEQDRDFLNKAKWPNDLSNENTLLLNYHPLQIYRHQVCKQADVVLALQLFDDKFDQQLILNTVKYYDKVTTHDSSLSFSTFATVYARLKHEKAFDYFLKNSSLDLNNEHKNTKDGIHTAAMGGTYQTIIEGFAGLKVVDGDIKFENNLPKEINKLTFKIIFRGILYAIEIGEEIKIEKVG